MDINLENFNVRKTKPYNAGPIGLPLGEERYIAKAQVLQRIGRVGRTQPGIVYMLYTPETFPAYSL